MHQVSFSEKSEKVTSTHHVPLAAGSTVMLWAVLPLKQGFRLWEPMRASCTREGGGAWAALKPDSWPHWAQLAVWEGITSQSRSGLVSCSCPDRVSAGIPSDADKTTPLFYKRETFQFNITLIIGSLHIDQFTSVFAPKHIMSNFQGLALISTCND